MGVWVMCAKIKILSFVLRRGASHGFDFRFEVLTWGTLQLKMPSWWSSWFVKRCLKLQGSHPLLADCFFGATLKAISRRCFAGPPASQLLAKVSIAATMRLKSWPNSTKHSWQDASAPSSLQSALLPSGSLNLRPGVAQALHLMTHACDIICYPLEDLAELP